MTILGLVFGFCIQWSILVVYLIVKHRNKPVLIYKEPWMQENKLNKFRTIVSEVLSFVGNPVYSFLNGTVCKLACRS